MSEQRRQLAMPAEPDREYEVALADYRAWDRRAAESQRCDIAVAAQRSLETLRALEARRGLKARDS